MRLPYNEPRGSAGVWRVSSLILRMAYPEFKEFSRLARSATLVPVVKSVSADLLTPFPLSLRSPRKSRTRFCWSRSSAVNRSAATPFWEFGPTCGCGRGVRPSRLNADAPRRHQGNVFEFVKLLLSEHQPASVPGLPPFTAGAVGYFSYDVVRQLENIGEHAKDDLSLPDCELMFFDRLLAFDHLRHQIQSWLRLTFRARVRGEPTTAQCAILRHSKENWLRDCARQCGASPRRPSRENSN